MTIQVLGSGCPTCKKLYDLTKQAAAEVGFKGDVKYTTDIQKMLEMGIMQSPAVAIDGKPVLSGRVPSLDELKKIIKEKI
ncbi:MAG: thioredoxin family protein [Patescibacteria group bacterium]